MRTTEENIVIGESSSTRTEWSLVSGGEVVAQAITTGLNPFFQTRREISHIVRLELPHEFFKRRWDHVYFYGAGCSNSEKIKTVEASLVAQFKSPTTVESDLLGAARGLLINEAGLACILGTGSNSCFYDGERITRHVSPCGFILGDEGSGSAMGRIFLGDVLKGLAPKHLIEAFYESTQTTPEAIMDSVYNNPYANRNLRNYSMFLADHLNEDYVYKLVHDEISRFFERHLCQYDYKAHPICFVGAVACKYSEILLQVATNYDAHILKIISSSMPGLVVYHSTNP